MRRVRLARRLWGTTGGIVMRVVLALRSGLHAIPVHGGKRVGLLLGFPLPERLDIPGSQSVGVWKNEDTKTYHGGVYERGEVGLDQEDLDNRRVVSLKTRTNSWNTGTAMWDDELDPSLDAFPTFISLKPPPGCP
jgi:hypothetical protein